MQRIFHSVPTVCIDQKNHYKYPCMMNTITNVYRAPGGEISLRGGGGGAICEH